MLFSVLFAIFAAVSTSVFGHRDGHAKACSRELEAIVFHPPNCAFDYMKKITQTLVIQSPLLWTDRAASVIETFENQFGVEAIFFDAFGSVWNYKSDDIEPPFNAFNYNYERTVAIGEAFAAYPGSTSFGLDVPFYAYSTLLWNGNGQMYTVVVLMNKALAPLTC